MKNWLRKSGHNICNVCLAYTIMFIISSYSNFLFGEPELPTED